MKKSYITLKRLFVTLAKQHLEKGDMLLYDTSMMVNNLTIYRGQQLVNTITHSPVGMDALVKAGIIAPVVDTNAPVVPVPPLTATQKVAVVAEAALLKAEVLVGEVIDTVKTTVSHAIDKAEPEIKTEALHAEAEIKTEAPVVEADIKEEAEHVFAEAEAGAPVIEADMLKVEEEAAKVIKKAGKAKKATE